jgi:UDP-N-acetylglucosamine acyltransferase
MVAQDIAPYLIAQGDRAKAVGINLVGLKRRNFSDETLRDIKQAYKLMFRSNLRQEEALARITAEVSEAAEIQAFVNFIRASERGVAR